MVFAQAVAHNAGALAVGLVRAQAQFMHGIQNAALHGLQAILHPGNGPLHDDVLRVGNHGVVHHVLQGGLDNPGGIILDDGALIAGFLRHGLVPSLPLMFG